MSELWTLNKFNLPHVSSCANGLIVQDLRSWRGKKKTSHYLSHHSYTQKKNIQYLSALIQASKTSCSHTVSCLTFLQIFYSWGFLHKLSLYTSSSLYWADKSSPLLSTRFFFAAVMPCIRGFEVCKWGTSDSPTYSGVPRISRTSVTLSTRRDKPKSTIRMSPRGWALVNRMFWGWRRHEECERKETQNYTSDRKKKNKNYWH